MKLLPLLIALVIPVFFLVLWGASSYHRLVALRQRCRKSLMDLEAAQPLRHGAVQSKQSSRTAPADKSQQEQLTTNDQKFLTARRAHDEAVAAYNAARDRFPASFLAAVFGFTRATPSEQHRE